MALSRSLLETSYAFERESTGTPSAKTSAYSVTVKAHFPSFDLIAAPPPDGGVIPSFRQVQMTCLSPGILHHGMRQFRIGACTMTAHMSLEVRVSSSVFLSTFFLMSTSK